MRSRFAALVVGVVMLFLAVGRVSAGPLWYEGMDSVTEWGTYQATFGAGTAPGTAKLLQSGAAGWGKAWGYAGSLDVSTFKYLYVNATQVTGQFKIAVSGPSDFAYQEFVVSTQAGPYVVDISGWAGNVPGNEEIFVHAIVVGTGKTVTFDEISIGNNDPTKPILFDRLKGFNYVLPNNFSLNFWDSYDHDTADRDLGMAASMYGITLNRFFISYTAFGGPNAATHPNMAKLQDYIDLHRKYGIRAVVTLFDHDFVPACGYAASCYPANKQYIDAIVGRFKDDPVIYAWDVKNEMDVDYRSYGTALCEAWAAEMGLYIRRLDPDAPITVGYCGESCGDRIDNNTNTFTNSLWWVDFVSMRFDGRNEPEVVDQINNIYQKTTKTFMMEEFGVHSAEFWEEDPKNEASQYQWYRDVMAAMDARQLTNRPFPTLFWTLNDLDASLQPPPNFPEFKSYEKALGLLRHPDQSSKPAGMFVRHHYTAGPSWRENFDSTNGWFRSSSATAVYDNAGAVLLTAGTAGQGYYQLQATNRFMVRDTNTHQELVIVAYRADGQPFRFGEGPDFKLTVSSYQASYANMGEFPLQLVDSSDRDSQSRVWRVNMSAFAWPFATKYWQPKITMLSNPGAGAIKLDLIELYNYSPEVSPYGTSTVWDALTSSANWNDTGWGGDTFLYTNGNSTADYLLDSPAGWGYNDSRAWFPASIVTGMAVRVHDIAKPNSYGLAVREMTADYLSGNVLPFYQYYQYSGLRSVDLSATSWGSWYWISPRLLYSGGPGQIILDSVDVQFRDESLVSTGGTPYVIEGNKKRGMATTLLFNQYGYDWNKVIQVSTQTLASIPSGVNVQGCLFVDRFEPIKNTWRDAADDPSFVATLAGNADGTATLQLPSWGTWGKALSPVFVNASVFVYPVVEVDIANVDTGAFVEINIQEEQAPWAHYKLIGGRFGPGRYAANVRTATGWLVHSFSIEVLIAGQGKSVRLNSVKMRSGNADPEAYVEAFNPPGTWRDEDLDASFNATITDNRDGTARIEKLPGDTWGKILTERQVINVTTNPIVKLDVRHVQEGAHMELNVQMQENNDYTHYSLINNIQQPGTYTADLRTLGLSGRHTFSLELVVADGIASRRSVAVVDKLSVTP